MINRVPACIVLDLLDTYIYNLFTVDSPSSSTYTCILILTFGYVIYSTFATGHYATVKYVDPYVIV